MGEGCETNALAEELEQVLSPTRDLWEELRGERVFITGGTGFFGCWLLESFAWANDRFKLGAEVLVLTRDVEAFRRKAPRLAANPAIRFHPGDVRNFTFPEGEFPFVIHAAAPSSARLNQENPLLMLDTIVEGTRRVLDFAVAGRTRKFLLTSSGAVYGRQPPGMSHVGEDHVGSPDPMNPRSAYGEGKRLAEMLCATYAREHGIGPRIARCFTFVGPYLPLDIHYAIGNFIKDGLGGGPIRITGDGTPYRSYLYASDLAVWLWTILLRGECCRPYNVGSERDVTIAETAREVARVFDPQPEVLILGKATPGEPPERYVPSTHRATSELGLAERITLHDALRRSVAWYKMHPS
jgi:dTDP-glucose 4,6-dehydratase